MRIDMAHHSDTILPPVKLYELGGVYFVRDGNHRISVAVAQDVEFVDAEVTSLDTDVDLSPDASLEDVREAVIALERKRFCENTGIDEMRPQCEIRFTETGRYDDLLEHIRVHRYYLSHRNNHEVSFERALISWYDNLYKPIIDTIQDEDILPRFPGRTEGDLYIWIIRHWDDLKTEYGEDLSIRSAAKSFSKQHGRLSLRYLFERLKSRLGMQL
jgi:hypothetical protein